MRLYVDNPFSFFPSLMGEANAFATSCGYVGINLILRTRCWG